MTSQDVAEIYGYTPRPIDPNLGLSMRSTPGEFRVYMYKRWPGIYLTSNGSFAKDEQAVEAGFDVDADRRRAVADGQVAEYGRQVRLALAENEARIRAGLPPEVISLLPPLPDQPAPIAPMAPPAPVDVVTERHPETGEPRGTKNFMLQHIGGGRWNVIDREEEASIESKLVIEDAIAAMIKAQIAKDDADRG